MSDSFTDYEQPRYVSPTVSVAELQAEVLALEAQVKYWRDATEHMFHVKGGCTCQGRAEKLWCRRCWIKLKFRDETGEAMK